LLLHLAATETYYQMNTSGGMKWDSWPDEAKKKWDIPMNLGEPARKAIKGNSLDYYLNALHQVLEESLAEFRKRDDKWLATVVTMATSQLTTMLNGFMSLNTNLITTARSNS
jgi:hypothetical protein